MYVVALVGVSTPTMRCPSGVRSSLPGKVVTGRVLGTAGSPAGVDGSAGTETGMSCWYTGSYTERVPCGTPETTPVPTMLTSARPSAPTSTPWGVEGSCTVWVTTPLARLMTLKDGLPLLVTNNVELSIDMAAASGVLPT